MKRIIQGEFFMKECTYYDLLGVPMDATEEEIVSAKNFLVKKMHPDANIDSGYDTTTYIQNILDAYKILSSPEQRRIYDRRIRNPIRRETAAERSGSSEYRGPLSPNFAPFWEAANKLNELVASGFQMLNDKSARKGSVIRKLSGRKKPEEEHAEQLAGLAKEAEIHVKVLESSGIPKKYWCSHAMNWMLFQWSQNREFAYAMLCVMYDSYLDDRKTAAEKKQIQSETALFLSTLDKIISCQTEAG